MKNIRNMVHIALLTTAIHASVFAKLLITPTRVDLNNSNKVQSLKLINESTEEVTYRIGYMYQNMTPGGSYQKLTDEEAKSKMAIEEMIMYSPRQVTLQPKETQTVRFALRRQDSTGTSELNAHILFKEVEKVSAIPQVEKKDDSNFSIEIKPLFNIAIPVFVSNANKNTKYEANISNVKFDKQTNVVTFDITNTGQYSPYGRAIAKFYKGRKLLDQQELNGLGITLPLKQRNVVLTYEDAKFDENEVNLIEITYVTASESGKSYTIASTKITI